MADLSKSAGVTIMCRGHRLDVSTTTSHITTDSCEGKQRYTTYAEADRQAWYAMARRRHADDDFMLAAHFCARCGGWHIGNPRKQAAERWSSSLA